MKCTVRTAKAYSSIEDKKALWPTRNFTDVVKANLAQNPTDCLVMSAPTVDITNIDTSALKQSDCTDIYQQNVHVSCQNMFNIAHDTVAKYPNIEKVIIMEHAPRHDTKDVDPEYKSLHQQCPQTLYQQKQKHNQKSTQSKKTNVNTRYHPSVQDSNRFSVFNSNSENQ